MTVRRLLRAAGALGVLALSFAPVLSAAGSAHADTPSPSASVSASAGLSTAGSTFRTATGVTPGRTAQADGSIGDYLYWSFQAQAGQAPGITATVQLPPGAQRHAAEAWRLDLYDGLRRELPCVAGSPQVQAAADSASVQLSCILPTVRSWAETWSNDPLPGTYYVRLTAADLDEQDLGLPVTAQLSLATPAGDAASSDGSLSAPLSLPSAGPSASPTAAAGDGAVTQSPTAAAASAAAADSGNSSSGFFSGVSDRWWWTGGGAVAASLTAVLGFSLTRHPRRWFS